MDRDSYYDKSNYISSLMEVETKRCAAAREGRFGWYRFAVIDLYRIPIYARD